MEMFDILNEDGTKTGRIKDRHAVHTDGDWHGSVHVWAYRIHPRTHEIEVLLQQRSDNKDSFPGCLDAASTGHADAGETFEQAAVREVQEEIGVTITPEKLHFVGTQKLINDTVFHGRSFVSNEINYIYVIDKSVDLSEIRFQKEEISQVMWHNLNDMIDYIREGSSKYCTDIEEIMRVWSYIIELQ